MTYTHCRNCNRRTPSTRPHKTYCSELCRKRHENIRGTLRRRRRITDNESVRAALDNAINAAS